MQRVEVGSGNHNGFSVSVLVRFVVAEGGAGDERSMGWTAGEVRQPTAGLPA